MINDNALMCFKTEDAFADGASVLGSGSIDLSAAKDVGPGEPLAPWARVTTAFAGAASTVALEAVGADDAALSENLVVLSTTPPIPVATLAVGYTFKAPAIPAGGGTKRYIGLRATTVGTGTAGKLEGGFATLDAKPANEAVKY